MGIFVEVPGSRMTEALGWFLIHSLWQGALVAGLLAITLLIVGKRSAELRYYASFVALLALLIGSGITLRKSLNYWDTKTNLTVVSDSKSAIAVSTLENTLKPERNAMNLTDFFLRSGIQNHFRWIVSIWFLGLLFYLIRTSGGLLRQVYLRRAGRIALEPEWQRKISELAKQLSIRKHIGIFGSNRINSPLCTGFIKPVILLPVSFLSGIPVEQVDAILIHELAHIKRNDYLINILQTLIETLFFYHPGVWYISQQIRKERENICDDMAILHTGDKLNYARALAEAQRNLLDAGQFALGFSRANYSILKRIKRLNSQLIMKTKLTEKLVAGTIVLSAFLLLSFMIDGSNQYMKKEIGDTFAKNDTVRQKKIVIVKSIIDSSGVESTTQEVYLAGSSDLDSVLHSENIIFDSLGEVTKTIEILLCDKDELLSEKELLLDLEIELKELEEGEMLFESKIIQEMAMDEEIRLFDSLEISHPIIIKKHTKGTKSNEKPIIIEVFADEGGHLIEYEYRMPEPDPRIEAELERAHRDLQLAQIELQEARDVAKLEQLRIQIIEDKEREKNALGVNEEMTDKEREAAQREIAAAEREMQAAMREMEAAEREMKAAERQMKYRYKYVIKDREKIGIEEFEIPDPNISLEEKEKILESELEHLEKELKEVKKRLREEKKSR